MFLSFWKRLASLPKKKRRILICAAITIPLVVLITGCILWPEVFWDQFVYRYFWGPVVSDMEGRPVSGVAEGYNIVNTVVYSVLLASVLYFGYRILRYLEITLNFEFILSCIPIFLLGGVARALEDASLFSGWVGYWFISPLIYVQIGLLFFASASFGYFLEKKYGNSRDRIFLNYIIFEVVLLAVYFSITTFWNECFAYDMPLFLPIIWGAVSFYIYSMAIRRGVKPICATLLSTGTLFLLIACSYASAFSIDRSWQLIFMANEGYLPEPHPMELLIIPGIALLLTLMIYISGKVCGGRLSALSSPINTLMFFAHFLDGSATYRGIDLYGYSEKHVLPTALIDLTGTASIMLLLKFMLVLLLVYLIDILFNEELGRYPGLDNVMKFAIIFLGLSPGVRDLVRIVLGV